MGSCSRLQGNFLTQESNQHLLHCRRILHQLSYPGSVHTHMRTHAHTHTLTHTHRHPHKMEYCCCCCCYLVTKLCQLFATPSCQAPLLMGFPRQEYKSGLHFLLQGIFLTQGLNSSLLLERWILYYQVTWEAHNGILLSHKKNAIVPFAATWMDLEIVILSEVTGTKTDVTWYHL